eukprot:COSAG01_NODE_1400_length_10454_cov_11.412747_4_plen_99_part_00
MDLWTRGASEATVGVKLRRKGNRETPWLVRARASASDAAQSSFHSRFVAFRGAAPALAHSAAGHGGGGGRCVDVLCAAAAAACVITHCLPAGARWAPI